MKNIALFETTKEFIVVAANQQAAELFKQPGSGLIGLCLIDLCNIMKLNIPFEDLGQTVCASYDFRLDDVIQHWSYLRSHTKDGSQKCIFSVVCEYIENAKLPNYQEILEMLPGNVYWKDTEGHILGCNKNALIYYGYESIEDVYGKTDFDTLDKEMAELVSQVDKEIIASAKPRYDVEEPCFKKTGKFYLTHKIPMFNNQGEVVGIVGVSLDISQRKKAQNDLVEAKRKQEELEQLNKQYLKKMNEDLTGEKFPDDFPLIGYAKNIEGYLKKIIAYMPGHVYWKDSNGVYLGCNDNALKYFGIESQEELIGKTDYDLIDRETANFVRPIDQKVIRTKQPIYNVEEPSFRKPIRIYLTQKVPLLNDKGDAIGLVGISFDITEQKELQKELENAKLREAELKEKIITAETLGGMIAHELRTPLATMRMIISDLDEYLPQLLANHDIALDNQAPVKALSAQVLNSLSQSPSDLSQIVSRCFLMIEMLLSNVEEVTKIPPDFGLYSMNTCVDEMLANYPFSSAEKNITIHWHPIDDFSFQGSKLLMTMVLINLLKNSLHFILAASKGDISIWVEMDDTENRLHIKDTGLGIKAEYLPKLFDKFFSKRKHGTGLGLAFCKNVMDNIYGSIYCHSKEDEYTEFVLVFPKVVEGNKSI